MRKFLAVLTVVILLLGLCACSDPAPSGPTFDEIVTAFENEGYDVDRSAKPYYEMIGASDGVMFYIDGQVVKIYEYRTQKAYQEALAAFDFIVDWPKNGLIVLETSNDDAKALFESIGK